MFSRRHAPRVDDDTTTLSREPLRPEDHASRDARRAPWRALMMDAAALLSLVALCAPRRTVHCLRADARRDGHDYSVGLAQINQRNFTRLGLSTETAFDPCHNVQAMQHVLGACMSRSQQSGAPQRALRDALSCYYSGNFRTGYPTDMH
jgi:hypothetical protein